MSHHTLRFQLLTACVLLSCAGTLSAARPSPAEGGWLTHFQERQERSGFVVEHLYLDSRDQPAGACLRHRSGFTLDLLPMETAPQSFVWISAPPLDDKGEPHTLEHLLLGKGRRGLSVANAEEFRLSSSSAFTGQLETCYHFSTALGAGDFLVELEDRLDALMHPDFSDEEIRREVCHVGPKDGPAGLELDEKGTVYNEMLSSWDNPWSRVDQRLRDLAYGPEHPLSNNAGGIPAEIRRLTPAEIRRFQQSSHFLGNMGAELVLAPGEMTDELLKRLDALLTRLEPARPTLPTRSRADLPPLSPAANAVTEVLEVPGAREGEPALVLAAWPPIPPLTRRDLLEAQIFLSVAASGESSDLYHELIDPQHAADPLGAAWISGWISEEPGQVVWLGLGSVPPARVTEAGLDGLRRRVQERLAAIADWPTGNPELEALKVRTLAELAGRRRAGRSLLDHPPGFGQRGTGSFWPDHLRGLRATGEFRLRLDEEPALASIEKDLQRDGNPFTRLLDKLQLTTRAPHVVGTRSSPALLAEKDKSREARLEAFADSLETAYATADRQEALRRFQADYDHVTATLEAQRAGLPTPALPAHLPLDNDPEIVLDTLRLAKDIPLCHGVFEGMQGARFSLAADVVAIGADNPWVAALPALLTQAGVDGPGGKLDHVQVEDALRREVSWAGAWLDADLEAGRGELVLGCAGGTPEECARGVQWLRRFLQEADWSEANRPRLREIVRRELANNRETRKGAEESWVEVPPAAWLQRDNPGLLRPGCFLTQEYDLFRCAWLLEDPLPEAADATRALALWTDRWRDAGRADSCRVGLRRLLDVSQAERATVWSRLLPRPWSSNLATASGRPFSDATCETLDRALRDLAAMAAEFPAESFERDWRQTCETMVASLTMPEDLRLADLRELRLALQEGTEQRAWFTGSRAAWNAVKMDALSLTSCFDDSRNQLWEDKRANARPDVLRGRPSTRHAATCVGLVDPGSTSGVVVFSAPLTNQSGWRREDLLNFLAGGLLGGGSDYGLFMQTWAAGLAYSNGIRARERTGVLRYYAERCTDAAQTLAFVEERVRQSRPVDRAMAETAIVTAHGGSREALDYDSRTSQRAQDLQLSEVAGTRGRHVMPYRSGPTRLDEQRGFRRGLQDLLKDKGLPTELELRKLPVHVRVLPGLAEGHWTPLPGTQLFLIGPERQFILMDEFMAARDPGMLFTYKKERTPDLIYTRLHPRDYWLQEPTLLGNQ